MANTKAGAAHNAPVSFAAHARGRARCFHCLRAPPSSCCCSSATPDREVGDAVAVDEEKGGGAAAEGVEKEILEPVQGVVRQRRRPNVLVKHVRVEAAAASDATATDAAR